MTQIPEAYARQQVSAMLIDENNRLSMNRWRRSCGLQPQIFFINVITTMMIKNTLTWGLIGNKALCTITLGITRRQTVLQTSDEYFHGGVYSFAWRSKLSRISWYFMKSKNIAIYNEIICPLFCIKSVIAYRWKLDDVIYKRYQIKSTWPYVILTAKTSEPCIFCEGFSQMKVMTVGYMGDGW